ALWAGTPGGAALAASTRTRRGVHRNVAVAVAWRNSAVTVSAPRSMITRLPRPVASSTARRAPAVPMEEAPPVPAARTGLTASTPVTRTVAANSTHGRRV